MNVTKSGGRLGPGIVVLLVILTAANVFALAVGVMTWRDEARHGGDLQAFVGIGVLLVVVALIGIAGAWARQEWGATLYFGAQATGFALTLYATPEAIGPWSFIFLLLAGLLWLCTR